MKAWPPQAFNRQSKRKESDEKRKCHLKGSKIVVGSGVFACYEQMLHYLNVFYSN